jgi:hypothetical protein
MTYSQVPNRFVTAANGVEYAYREMGEGTVPLVLLMHFSAAISTTGTPRSWTRWQPTAG